MKKLLVLFGLMFAIFACSNDCMNVDVPQKNSNKNNQSNTEDPGKRPTTLQDVVDNANAGEEIDLSDYELTSYTATVNKKLTIKNGSLNNAKLQITGENVKLEKLTDLSVTSSSRLTINDSKLSNLLIGGNGETSRSRTSEAQTSLAMVTVTDSEIENVELNGFNSQLNITDTVTQIDDILISTKAKVILEAGSYDGMKDPTVTNGGEAVRVDMTKDTQLSVLSIYSSPQKLEYNIGDKIDLAGLIVMGTYSTNVETFKTGGWKGESLETITKWEDEKDYTVSYDFNTAGVSIVTVTSTKYPEIKCNFHVFVKDSQSGGTSQPEKEEIEITKIELRSFGTPKTLYKVGEKLDLSCYQVVGTYNGFEINLPFTSEPANGTPLTTENTKITFSYNGKIVDTQTITVTKLYYTVTFKDGEETLYTLEVADGELLKLPVVDERTGYTFDGWYKDDGTKIEADYKVTENLTLTAKWNEENAYYVSSNKGKDDEGVTGSKDSPFKTLQAAVNKVINDGTSPYTIYVMDGITGTDSDFTNNNKALINVVPGENKSLTLKICGYNNTDVTIDAQGKGRVMYIGENANVALENLILTGGYLKDEKGAGLYILNSTAEVTIKNCEIKENTIDNGCGAGIFVALNNVSQGENLKLTIENSKISSNTINHNDSTTEYSGAGIAIENVGANIAITNSEINSNKINQDGIKNTNPGDKGVGLWLGNKATTIISGTAIKNNIIENAASTNENAGGGVYLNGGTLEIQNSTENNTIISGNSSGYGGGVYVGEGTEGDGTFNMAGGTISDCTAEQGGGVYVEKGTFTMSGGTISGNEADCGGGIYLTGTAQLIMTGGKISGNSAYYGGGVHISGESSKFAMKGGEISGNSAEYGGGVAVDGLFFMSGGTISGNEVTNNSNGNGSGVYVAYIGNSQFAATFEMSGGAVVDSNNDVYLANGTSVTVTGNLTSEGTVATITPNEYSATRQVLVAGSGVALSSSLVKQFNVTPDNNGNEWFVDLYGYLGKVPEKETNGDGTVVYSMESYDNMLWIARELKTGSITSFNMKLTNDIEIPSGKWQFYQLNVDAASTIDGQGHSITINEDVSSFGNDAGGLFYKLNNSTVKNLVLMGSITANTSAEGYIGALCRSAYRTTIQNVMSTVEIIDEGSGNAGGLVGYFGGNSNMNEYQPGSFIQNCAVYANIKSTNGTVGGLVGGTWDGVQCWQINNCIYAGTVTGGTNQGVGAIIGTHNTGRKSTFTDTWYYANGTSEIVGKYNNDGNGENFDGYDTVISKNPADIASEDAATLLNTNSDGTSNDAWEYVEGEAAYPTLKIVN